MFNSSIIFIIFVCGLISFIIGLPTFLLGCNPSVSNECVAYNTFNGIVYKTKVYEKTCSRCSKKDEKGNCKQTYYYSCWDAYVFAHHKNSNNQTTSSCKIQTANSYTSEYMAEQTTKKYDIGEKVDWYKKKGTNECETGGTVITLWYVGIVFLSFTGLMVLFGLINFMFILFEQIPNYTIINTNFNIETKSNIFVENKTSVQMTEINEEKI